MSQMKHSPSSRQGKQVRRALQEAAERADDARMRSAAVGFMWLAVLSVFAICLASM